MIESRLTSLDKDGVERDHEHFEPPFLLAVYALLSNVPNLTRRVLPWGHSPSGRVLAMRSLSVS